MGEARRQPSPPANEVWLRVAHSADADAIVRLVNQAFQVERFFLDGDRIHLEAVRELLNKGKFLLAEQAGTLVGCVYLEPRGDRFYLGLLSVDPARQRSGVGRLLMRVAEADCRSAGARGIDLQLVSLRTELPGYYRCLGYEENGTAPFPESVQPRQPCYFIKMSKELGTPDQS